VKRRLDQLRQRAGYRVLEAQSAKVGPLAPWSTRRRQIVLAGAKVAKVVMNEGPTGA